MKKERRKDKPLPITVCLLSTITMCLGPDGTGAWSPRGVHHIVRHPARDWHSLHPCHQNPTQHDGQVRKQVAFPNQIL
jgi:hypothetical protein